MVVGIVPAALLNLAQAREEDGETWIARLHDVLEAEADHAREVAVALCEIEGALRRELTEEILPAFLQAFAVVGPGVAGGEVFVGVAAHVHQAVLLEAR